MSSSGASFGTIGPGIALAVLITIAALMGHHP